ncbi:MAG: type VI secretion protein IcmF/TssM N-terminal domain-containing protein [Planctomycetaceae bacterium]
MSDEASKSVGRLRLFVAGVSGAAWITFGTFCGMLLLTLLAWLLAWNNPLWVPWGAYLTLSRGAWLLGLAIAACLAEYLLFRIWFDETPMPNRDLRAGWTAGLRQLRQDAADPRSLPCFLVIDPVKTCERWFDAAGLRVQTPDVSAESPVQWFFGSEATFLVVRGLGCLGALSSSLEEIRRRPLRYVTASPARQLSSQAVKTTSIGAEDDAALDNDPSFGFAPIDAEAVRDELLSTRPFDDRRGTPRPGDEEFPDELEVSDARVSSLEVARQSRRLSEVCRRLAACRRPVVPVNGVCVLLPEGLLSNLSGSGLRLGQALRHDLRLLQEELQVVAPVSVLLTGAEADPGVVELIRRTGQEAATSGEWGLACSPGRATTQSVGRYCDSLLQSLQQHVGRKLREPREVGRPGAERLFRLLSSLRGERGREFREFVAQAFSGDPDADAAVLAGVSLAATGEHPTERAFAKAAHRQLLCNQEFVEWTDRGRRSEQRMWRLTGFCGVLAVLAGFALIALAIAGR